MYQCACPAQVCVAIDNTRDLYRYQSKCLDATDIDRKVHTRIQTTVEQNHSELEKCLSEILKIEAWDMETLEMPSNLVKRLIDNA